MTNTTKDDPHPETANTADSDSFSRAQQWVDRLEQVRITVDGKSVVCLCPDARLAEDLADNIALIVIDKIAAWNRVIDAASPLPWKTRQALTRLAQDAKEGADDEKAAS